MFPQVISLPAAPLTRPARQTVRGATPLQSWALEALLEARAVRAGQVGPVEARAVRRPPVPVEPRGPEERASRLHSS